MDGRHGTGAHILKRFKVRLTLKEAAAGERFPEHYAERENICSEINFLADGGFGREVSKFTFDDAGVGRFELRRGAREPKVRQFDFAIARNQDVRRRNIAVHDVLRLPITVEL